MRKAIILFLSFILLTSISYGQSNRTCETIYSNIGGINYFSAMHCTEDIKLASDVGNKLPLKDVSARELNEFIVQHSFRIENFIKDGGICEEVNTITELKSFEDKIYSINGLNFSSDTSRIESLTTEIEDLIELHNSKDLYNTIFDLVEAKYPLTSIEHLRIETQEEYLTEQEEIKDSIIDKQEEKLTLLYKLDIAQTFIEKFYDRLYVICDDYNEEFGTGSTSGSGELDGDIDGDKTEEEIEEEKIKKYKEEFNAKLGEKFDALPREKLQHYSVMLIGYPYTSKIFKRLNDEQQAFVMLKIKALKAIIDDRL